jgi:diguanylate cyclase (GGDEF)-like protein/putative nucleotidyltransferase with HDIG domain
MSIYSLPALLSAIAFFILILIVLKKMRTRLSKTFIVYLAASIIYALGTFILLADFFPSQILLLALFPSLVAIIVAISYYHFVCVFTHKVGRLAVWLGYAHVLFILLPLALLGYFPESAQLTNTGLIIDYGIFIYPNATVGFVYIVLSILRLLQRYRASTDPLERSRVMYLFIGMAVVILIAIREGFPPLPRFPLSQVANLCNALIITYIIMRFQLLNIKLVIKKGLVYTGITATITCLFLGILYILQEMIHDWSRPESIAAILCLATVLSLSFNWLRKIMEKTVNIIFYGKSYDYRKMVLNFAQRMNNVLDLNQLAEAMLQPISKALSTNQVSLLLADNGKFTSRFAVRFIQGEVIVPIKLRKESPIISWLTEEKKPLSRDIIDVNPNFKALWQADIKAITDVEVLFPLLSKDKLVGILALSKRRTGGLYNNDDIDLITTLASEAAIAIENAELYAKARERANIDDLTGLFNHRYFHQRTDEEITRSSRFGEVFCLLSIDLDFFKTYNDVHGHLYGDEILRKVGETIKASIRNIDMAFRYGGDEFSIILPQTSIDGAYKAAERIRKSLESEVDTKSRLLTCSIGIASWPTDGVMREELIRTADTALYYAKQTGGNRTCLASELPISEALDGKFSINNKGAILNTIYALAATVDAKDHYTYGHSKKVSKYATDLAVALGLSDERVSAIHAAALLHDIGKIGVSDQILGKAGPLNDDEWEPIYAHPTMGVSILKHVDSLKDCLAAVQYHHERYDGTGYPSGLKGSNIPLDARILAIADTFDAMTSSRPYRNQIKTHEEAIEEIKRGSGTQFDPDIARVFIEMMTSMATVKNGTRKIDQELTEART